MRAAQPPSRPLGNDHQQPAEPTQPAWQASTNYPQEPVNYTATPAVQQPDPNANTAGGWEITDRPNTQLAVVSQRLQVVLALNPNNFPQLLAKYAQSQRSAQILRNTATSDTYEGAILNQVPHGWGKLVTVTGGIVEGFFENGAPADYIRKVDNTGNLQEGHYANGAFTGRGFTIDGSGRRADYENLVNGLPDGKVTVRDIPTQRLLLDGTFKSGQKNGPVAAFYDVVTRSTLSGNFVNDLLEGSGKRVSDNGQIYEGEFKRSIEEGKGTITFVDGRRWTGSFLNGKANGPGTLFAAGATTGKPATFKDGVKQA